MVVSGGGGGQQAALAGRHLHNALQPADRQHTACRCTAAAARMSVPILPTCPHLCSKDVASHHGWQRGAVVLAIVLPRALLNNLIHKQKNRRRQEARARPPLWVQLAEKGRMCRHDVTDNHHRTTIDSQQQTQVFKAKRYVLARHGVQPGLRHATGNATRPLRCTLRLFSGFAM